MTALVGEVLAVDESFTVKFPEHLPTSEFESWTYLCSEAGVRVEPGSDHAFRVLCSTTLQLRIIYLLWHRGSADVRLTTTTSGNIEALFDKCQPSWTASGKSTKSLLAYFFEGWR